MLTRLARLPITVALVAVSSGGTATPVTYNIVFGAPSSGTVTPSGSFVYDANLATNQQFLRFTVTFADTVFDLSGAANAFQFRTDAGDFHTSCMTPAVNDAFELLTNAPCVAAVASRSSWDYFQNNQLHYFVFESDSGSGSNAATDEFGIEVDSFGIGEDSAIGSFVAVAVPSVPAAIPEPGAAALAAIGVVALLVARRRKRTPQGS